MKFWNSLSIYTRWLIISAIITCFCVASGLYITKRLTEQEMERHRPVHGSYQADLIRKISQKTHLSVEEAYDLVMRSNHRMIRLPSQLVDEKNNIIKSDHSFFSDHRLPGKGPGSSHPKSRHPKYCDLDKKIMKNANRFEITPTRFLLHPDNFKRPMGPPPEAIIIGTISMAVSIIVGLGLSIIFMNVYVRNKSRQAEAVINRMKGGDLKARFEITDSDEAGELMVKFNDMAQQIESLVENLRKTEDSRKRLLQELAHDLRTPVASMKNFLEILIEKGHLVDEEKRSQIQTMAFKEVTYFERLVEDLLFLSGVNDPRYSTQFRGLNLGSLILEELEFWESDKIKIHTKLCDDAIVLGDDHLLKRLIKNALSNASRYARGQIEINLEVRPEHILLCIVDDGPGLKEEELSVFGQKKFSRKYLDEGHTHISIGLGSVIMKKIMELHEGDLHVENRTPGLRLCFTFPHPSSFHHPLLPLV